MQASFTFRLRPKQILKESGIISEWAHPFPLKHKIQRIFPLFLAGIVFIVVIIFAQLPPHIEGKRKHSYPYYTSYEFYTIPKNSINILNFSFALSRSFVCSPPPSLFIARSPYLTAFYTANMHKYFIQQRCWAFGLFFFCLFPLDCFLKVLLRQFYMASSQRVPDVSPFHYFKFKNIISI